jgi:hypothetical protein
MLWKDFFDRAQALRIVGDVRLMSGVIVFQHSPLLHEHAEVPRLRIIDSHALAAEVVASNQGFQRRQSSGFDFPPNCSAKVFGDVTLSLAQRLVKKQEEHCRNDSVDLPQINQMPSKCGP